MAGQASSTLTSCYVKHSSTGAPLEQSPAERSTLKWGHSASLSTLRSKAARHRATREESCFDSLACSNHPTMSWPLIITLLLSRVTTLIAGSPPPRTVRSTLDPDIVEAARVGKRESRSARFCSVSPLNCKHISPASCLLRCQYAVSELQKLSDSGVYESLSLSRIASAATQVGELLLLC